MPKKLDLRVEKTYESLYAALSQLLVEKPFEQISVTELCGRARTRRATFYKHFGDKYEFLKFMIRRQQERLTEETVAEIALHPDTSPTETFVRHGLAFLEDNAEVLLSLRNGGMLPMLVDSSLADAEDMQALLNRFVPNRQEDATGETSTLPLYFSLGALASSGMWWLENRDHVNREAAIAQIVNLLNRL